MLQLQKEKQQINFPDKLNQLEARIKYTNDKINQLVFELYGFNSLLVFSEGKVRQPHQQNELKETLSLN